MEEHVIYTAMSNGSDAASLGALIIFFLFGGFFIFQALRLRRAQRSGLSLTSRSTRTTAIRNFLANYTNLVVAAICCLLITLTFLATNGYRSDSRALASGNYKSLAGKLDGYRIADVAMERHRGLSNGIAGLDSTFQEKDAVILRGWTFYVLCTRPLSDSLPTVGTEGRCLNLHVGQDVRIDYLLTSETTYRSEPLRISVIN
jgi:hypothetical protein